MGTSAAESFIERPVQPLRVWHALLVFTSPRAVFRRVEDTGAYGWALVTLLGLVILIGYATVQTGLIDQVLDQKTETSLADLEKTQINLVDRARLQESMEDIRKQGEFNKLLARLGAVAFAPVQLLASYLLIASGLYAMVALTGRKPEYHTLMSICVYAGFIELVAYGVQLAMRLNYRRLDVDTTLAMLAPPGTPSVWAAVDPFAVWFWILVGIGLAVTHQLSRRMAVVSCLLMGLTAMGGRVALQYAAAGS